MEILTINELLEQNIRADIARTGGKGVIYSNIDNDSYHSGPGLSSTNLKTIFSQTITDYLYEKQNFKETPALIFGSAFHTRVLEPDFFSERFYRENDIPEIPKRNTRDGKEQYAMWMLENETLLHEKYNGKLDSDQWKNEYIKWIFPALASRRLMTDKNIEALEKMNNSVCSNPYANAALNGIVENSIYWVDKESDLLLKCRPDCLNTKLSCIVDLKSCRSAVREPFQKDIASYLYHLSASFYVEGVKQVIGEEFEFLYIACEKDKTFKNAVYRADHASIEAGEELYRMALSRFKKWKDDPLKNNASLPVVITDIGLPPFAFNYSFAYGLDDE